MEHQLTLPALQRRLNGLAAAQTVAISNEEVHRLFGFNDVAIGRIKRFASGHNCIVSYGDKSITFLKAPACHAKDAKARRAE